MYAIIDSETSGFKTNYIAQFSYILMDREFNCERVYNGFYQVPIMEEGAEKVHGYSKEWLASVSDATFHQHRDLGLILDDLKGRIIIGHNVQFDKNMININLDRVSIPPIMNPEFCTYIYLKYLAKKQKYPGKQNKKLESFTKFMRLRNEDLQQVVPYLFDCGDVGFHDSRWDVSVIFSAITVNKDLRDFIQYIARTKYNM